MADHTPQAEFERAVKAIGLDPRILDSAQKPGEVVTIDESVLEPLSLYIHIPTPEGMVGRNIVVLGLQRPLPTK